MKILILLFLTMASYSQETYKWSQIEEIRFCDLANFDCKPENTSKAKTITYKKPLWENILPARSNAMRDFITEPTCYMLLVKFRGGETIPFQLFPNQKALFDTRESHFNFIQLRNDVYKRFDEAIRLSIKCLNDPNCQQVK